MTILPILSKCHYFPRFILRVLRALPVTRRKLNPVVLRTVLKTFYTADADKVRLKIYMT